QLVTSIAGVEALAEAGVAARSACTEGQPSVSRTTARHFIKHPELATEAFGPFTLIILAENADEIRACAEALEGQLTATVHATAGELVRERALLALLEQKAGRVLVNGFPTGVEVCPSMNHGGPYPATSDVRFTSVGTAA